MTTFTPTSAERSLYYDKVASDLYGHTQNTGVIALIHDAITGDYIEIFELIKNVRCDRSEYYKSLDMDSILESKWMTHVYDLEGTLN